MTDAERHDHKMAIDLRPLVRSKSSVTKVRSVINNLIHSREKRLLNRVAILLGTVTELLNTKSCGHHKGYGVSTMCLGASHRLFDRTPVPSICFFSNLKRTKRVERDHVAPIKRYSPKALAANALNPATGPVLDASSSRTP